MEISREDHRIFIEEQGQLPAEFTFPFVDKRTDEGGGSCDKEEVLEMYGI